MGAAFSRKRRRREDGKRFLCFWFVVVVSACSTAGEPAARARDVEPHIDAFTRFERWTHRTLSASVEMRDATARREALFAPLGLDSSVAGARVIVDETPYDLRDVLDAEWVRVQVDGREIEAARSEEAVGVARSSRVGHHEVRLEMWFTRP